MAISFIGNVCSVSDFGGVPNEATGAKPGPFSYTVTADLAAGTTLVLTAITLNPFATVSGGGFQDSQGNAYRNFGGGFLYGSSDGGANWTTFWSNGSTLQWSCYACTLDTALTAGDTISITSGTIWSLHIDQFSGIGGVVDGGTGKTLVQGSIFGATQLSTNFDQLDLVFEGQYGETGENLLYAAGAFVHGKDRLTEGGYPAIAIVAGDGWTDAGSATAEIQNSTTAKNHYSRIRSAYQIVTNPSTHFYRLSHSENVYQIPSFLTMRGLGWVCLTPANVADTAKVSFTRHPSDHRLLLAYTDSAGAVKVNRYNDAIPDGVAETVTLETSGGTGVSIQYHRSGVATLVYTKSGTVYLRTTRNQGRSWSVATTVASGYDDDRHWVDEASGMLHVALYKTSESRWYHTVGELNAGGTAWTFTTPTTLVSSSKQAGDFHVRRDGVLEFSYVTSAGVVSIVRCRSMPKSGGGSFT